MSLKAVSSAAFLYRNFKMATIDIRVLGHHLWESPWICGLTTQRDQSRACQAESATSDVAASMHLEVLTPFTLDLRRAFSCICFFESGRFRPTRTFLQNVMAMCSNDLIWVASRLVNDPATDCPKTKNHKSRSFQATLADRVLRSWLLP